ncbi:hypothetical protein AAVH_27643 [Aphelenchoides avenae]|nr:hypothetical protein AAVH_27643 [Aphelenchus avenae]
MLKRLLGMLDEVTTATASSSSISGRPCARKPKYTAEERREQAKELQREIAENAAKNVAVEVRWVCSNTEEANRMLAEKNDELTPAINALQRDRDDDHKNDHNNNDAAQNHD